jgi:hypothetical protein
MIHLLATCPGRGFGVCMMCFLVVLLSLTVGATWGVFRLVKYCAGGRPASQAARGLCARCGYDVRATARPGGPRLPRCPECGTLVLGS